MIISRANGTNKRQTGDRWFSDRSRDVFMRSSMLTDTPKSHRFSGRSDDVEARKASGQRLAIGLFGRCKGDATVKYRSLMDTELLAGQAVWRLGKTKRVEGQLSGRRSAKKDLHPSNSSKSTTSNGLKFIRSDTQFINHKLASRRSTTTTATTTRAVALAPLLLGLLIAASGLWTAAHGQPNQDEGVASGAELAHDCRLLASAWSQLHSSYPRLSAHLALLESAGAGMQQPAADTVARLLAEAEQTLAGKPAPGSWLARVAQHPVYGKMVQHFQSQQQLNQRMHQQQTSRQSPNQRPRQSEAEGEKPDERSFGKLIYYPHEAQGQPSSRETLARLRQLSQQREHEASVEAEIESNRIPQQAIANGHENEPQSAAKLTPLHEETSDKLVYGNLVHRPSQKWPARSADKLDSSRQASAGAARMADSMTLADSYGRLLDGPAAGQEPAKPNEMRPSGIGHGKTTLESLKQRLDLADNAAGDNLRRNPAGAASIADDFEGQFLEGPFGKVEVRHERAGAVEGEPKVIVVQSPANNQADVIYVD